MPTQSPHYVSPLNKVPLIYSAVKLMCGHIADGHIVYPCQRDSSGIEMERGEEQGWIIGSGAPEEKNVWNTHRFFFLCSELLWFCSCLIDLNQRGQEPGRRMNKMEQRGGLNHQRAQLHSKPWVGYGGICYSSRSEIPTVTAFGFLCKQQCSWLWNLDLRS